MTSQENQKISTTLTPDTISKVEILTYSYRLTNILERGVQNNVGQGKNLGSNYPLD